jgi:hypothetical protein
MNYIMRKTTKLDDVRWGINRVEFLPDTILALKDVLDTMWERGYQYAQKENTTQASQTTNTNL